MLDKCFEIGGILNFMFKNGETLMREEYELGLNNHGKTIEETGKFEQTFNIDIRKNDRSSVTEAKFGIGLLDNSLRLFHIEFSENAIENVVKRFVKTFPSGNLKIFVSNGFKRGHENKTEVRICTGQVLGTPSNKCKYELETIYNNGGEDVTKTKLSVNLEVQGGFV